MQEEVESKIVQATEFRKVAKKIITTLESKRFKLVRIKKLEGKKNIFQIMVEKVDFKPVSIENCAKISKIISNILDLEDPIKDNYYLEISSPGIERPLIEQLDFKRYKGNLIKVKVSNSEEHSSYIGLLTHCSDQEIHLLDKKTSKKFCFSYSSISDAQVIMENKNDKIR